jgi:membrane-associated phospholipid phosphatase
MLNKQLTVITIIIWLIYFPLMSSDSSENLPTDNKDPKSDTFFKALLKDEAEIWTSPLRFSIRDWAVVAGLSAVTGYLIVKDESLYERVKTYQMNHAWVDKISPSLTLLGDGNVSLGISGLFFISGSIFKDRKARDTSKLVLMSLIHSGIVVQLLKHLSGRQRPEAEDGQDHWAGPSGFFKRYKNHSDMFYDSFPSGHTITVWSTATVIAHQYNKTPFIPILSYSLAALSGMSRVTEDKHWVSDVVVGAVLGFAIGKFVYKKRSSRFLITPLYGRGTAGINLGICIR